MDAGIKVKGIYLGDFNFSGVVESRRPVTVQSDGCWLHTVVLDNPITIYGEKREKLLISTKYDGKPSSYVKNQDTMTLN